MHSLDEILTGFPTPDKPFDVTIGGPSCFSPRDVVAFFKWGATLNDYTHLLSCRICGQWVENYAQRPSTGKKAGWQNAWKKASVPQPAWGALLFMKDRECVVAANAPSEVSFIMMLPEGVGSRVEPKSLKLTGALTACEATIERNVGQYPTVRFSGAQLAENAVQEIRRHNSVRKTVHVTGALSGSDASMFIGSASMTLLRGTGF